MIFEMRTYRLQAGSVPKFEELFGAGLPGRLKFSPLSGFWHTEVGTLNQVIHIWPYESIGERSRLRAEAVNSGAWPPKTSHLIVEMESKILHPAPFSPGFEPGEHGNLYEFRTYTFGPGAIPKVIEAWTPRIKARTAVSPLIFAGFTDIGALNQWVHVWAYKNMGERERLREQARKPGQWPPPRDESIILHKQESFFAVPAPFSALK